MGFAMLQTYEPSMAESVVDNSTMTRQEGVMETPRTPEWSKSLGLVLNGDEITPGSHRENETHFWPVGEPPERSTPSLGLHPIS